jgi:hypothetical protein
VHALVQNGVGDLEGLVTKDCPRERIVEPAERAVGGGGSNVGIEPRPAERVGEGVRTLRVEVAPIGDASDYGKPPRYGLETVRGGGRHHRDELPPLAIHQVAVALRGCEPDSLAKGDRTSERLEPPLLDFGQSGLELGCDAFPIEEQPNLTCAHVCQIGELTARR